MIDLAIYALAAIGAVTVAWLVKESWWLPPAVLASLVERSMKAVIRLCWYGYDPDAGECPPAGRHWVAKHCARVRKWVWARKTHYLIPGYSVPRLEK